MRKPGSNSGNRISHRAELWIGLWGGGTAWLVHLLLAYGLGEFGCLSGFGKTVVLGVSILAWLLLAVSAVTLAGAAYSAWMAWRARNHFFSTSLEAAAPDNPELALARTAIIANLLFFFIIAVQTIPLFFFLREC